MIERIEVEPDIDHMDDKKPEEMALYTFKRIVDGKTYGGELPARSAQEAAEICQKMGFQLEGRFIQVEESRVCSICGGPMITDKTHVEPVEPEEWPDDL